MSKSKNFPTFIIHSKVFEVKILKFSFPKNMKKIFADSTKFITRSIRKQSAEQLLCLFLVKLRHIFKKI